MFRWFQTFLKAENTPRGEQELRRTIAQLHTCREHLAQLLEEARLTRQILGVTEEELKSELQRHTRPAKQLKPKTFSPDDRQREAI